MAQQDRLRWLCRRGTRELDLMLMRYLDTEYPTTSLSQQTAFQRLLECTDPQLQEFLFGQVNAPEPELQEVVERILNPKT